MSLARIIAAMVGLLTACVGLVAAHATTPVEPVEPKQPIMVMLAQPPSHYRADQGYGGGYGDARARALLQRKAQKIARSHGYMLVASWPMPLLGLDCVVLDVPEGQSASAAIARLAKEPGVAWSQPVNAYRTKSAQHAGDPMARAQPAVQQWDLTGLQKLATGRGVRVAVIDSQIDCGPSRTARASGHQSQFPAGTRRPPQSSTAPRLPASSRRAPMTGLGSSGSRPVRG